MATRFCFSIDGLDEFDGDHMETIDVINSLIYSNNIKICFSSRPWVVFEQAYGANFGLKLKVHELTRVDITRFLTDKLAEVTQLQQLKTAARRYEKLVLEIVDKSNGVFLWVFLVVQSLRRGLTNLDTIAELQRRLQILPRELEVFFRHIINSVEKVHHKKTARLYQIRLCALGQVSVMDVCYIAEEDANFALVKEAVSWNDAEDLERCDITPTRVMAHCPDLLDFSEDHHLHFLHRTVKYFLETKNMQSILVEEAGNDFDAHQFLCNASLMQMRYMFPKSRGEQSYVDPVVLLWNFMYHAHQMELRGRLGYYLFPKLDRTMALHEGGRYNMDCDWDQVVLKVGHHEAWLTDRALKEGIQGCLAVAADNQVKILNERKIVSGWPPLDVVLRSMDSSRLSNEIVKQLWIKAPTRTRDVKDVQLFGSYTC